MLVKESISFQRGLDPKEALKVGIAGSSLRDLLIWIFNLYKETMEGKVLEIWFKTNPNETHIFEMLLVIENGTGSPSRFLNSNPDFTEYFTYSQPFSPAAAHLRQAFAAKYYILPFLIERKHQDIVTGFVHMYGHFFNSEFKEDEIWVIKKQNLIK